LTISLSRRRTYRESRDDILHSVIGAKGEFRSKALDTVDRFSFTFAKMGSYGFFCGLHPQKQGRIVVTPRSANGHRVRVATTVMFVKGMLFVMACTTPWRQRYLSTHHHTSWRSCDGREARKDTDNDHSQARTSRFSQDRLFGFAKVALCAYTLSQPDTLT
jgi:hypothetical protein